MWNVQKEMEPRPPIKTIKMKVVALKLQTDKGFNMNNVPGSITVVTA